MFWCIKKWFTGTLICKYWCDICIVGFLCTETKTTAGYGRENRKYPAVLTYFFHFPYNWNIRKDFHVSYLSLWWNYKYKYMYWYVYVFPSFFLSAIWTFWYVIWSNERLDQYQRLISKTQGHLYTCFHTCNIIYMYLNFNDCQSRSCLVFLCLYSIKTKKQESYGHSYSWNCQHFFKWWIIYNLLLCMVIYGEEMSEKMRMVQVIN